MGIEKDYLMRQLMMLFEVISRIIRLRKKGEDENAMDEINYFYSCLKIEENIKTMNIEDLLDLLENVKKLTNEHIEMVAYVLKEQGELSGDKKTKLDFFRKSWFLLDKVERESVSFSMDRQMKMAELREYLN
jgi:predicted house-cleaning noncanonical NTP pyrophosphatase (MazG superfamily)